LGLHGELKRVNEHMNQSRRGECENVVELLVREYFAKYRSDLNRRIGSITADFINRGRFNSTDMVARQMGAELEYLDGLVNYVIGSLKGKFRYISLFDCKDKLVAILDTEYKRLILKANSLLVKAGLANQANLDNLQKRILDGLVKAKGKIEILCAIVEKQKSGDGDAKSEEEASCITLKAVWITLAAAIIGLVGTSPYWGPRLYKMLGGSGNSIKVSTISETSGEYFPPSVKNDGRSITTEETGAGLNEAKEKRLRKEEVEFDKANRTGDPGGAI